MSRTAETTSRTPKTSGPPLRALAMVLISLAILFAGLGFASLTGGSDDAASTSPTTEPAATGPATDRPAAGAPAAPTTAAAAAPTSVPAVAAGTPARPTSLIVGAPDSAVAVRVYNNSEVAGLAARTAGLLEDEGFTVSETGNYSEGLLPQTSVYYGTGAGEQETAQAVAAALGITALPRFDGIADAEPGVIVIVTAP